MIFLIALQSSWFVTGQNENGQLSTNSTKQYKQFTQTPVNEEFDKIIVSRFNILALKNNQLYGSGNSQNGQLGQFTNFEILQKLNAFQHLNITDMAAGTNHTVVLTSDGKVRTAGANNYYQLGVNTSNTSFNLLQEIDTSKITQNKITKVGATQQSTYLITDKSEIFVIGYCYNGMCGIDINGKKYNYTVIKDFTQMKLPFDSTQYQIKDIQFQLTNIVIKDSKDQLWVMGNSFNGQLCTSDEYIDQATNMQINGQNVVQISISNTTGLYLTNKNELYFCGENYLDKSVQKVYTPTKLQKPTESQITHIQAQFLGWVIAFADDSIYACGDNEMGQLGIVKSANYGNFEQILKSKQLSNLYSNTYSLVVTSLLTTDKYPQDEKVENNDQLTLILCITIPMSVIIISLIVIVVVTCKKFKTYKVQYPSFNTNEVM